jgi:hypothetical protein
MMNSSVDTTTTLSPDLNPQRNDATRIAKKKKKKKTLLVPLLRPINTIYHATSAQCVHFLIAAWTC